MKVKNDFPDVDRVLRKLRDYVRFFEGEKEKKNSVEDIENAEDALKQVDEFIEAIENYLDSVCNDEDKIKRFKDSTDSVDDIKAYVKELDEKRTRNHSAIIRQMIVIDRVAKKNDLIKVFDYAEEFENGSFTVLIPETIEEKNQMTERQRVKRREMGNFGLYIAASSTVGLSMPDREVRAFASCESDDFKLDETNEVKQAYDKVKAGVRKSAVSKNMNDMLR